VVPEEETMKAVLSIATVVALHASASAQTDIPRGGSEVRWGNTCTESATFVNKTGRLICDFRFVQIAPAGAPFVRTARLEDGVGQWPVDDNADGTVGAPGAVGPPAVPSEQDFDDGSPTGTTRIEKGPGSPPGPPGAPTGQCIPAGGTFGITLCGDGGANLSGHRFQLVPTAGSDGDIAMVPGCEADGSQVLALATAYWNPFGKYSIQGRPQGEEALAELAIASRDEAVSVVAVTTEPPGEFDPGSGRVFFAAAVPASTPVTVDFELQGTSSAAEVQIALSRCLVPDDGETPVVPPVGGKRGCPGCASSDGATGAVLGTVAVLLLLRRRRRG
jgi:hypothetical protein